MLEVLSYTTSVTFIVGKYNTNLFTFPSQNLSVMKSETIFETFIEKY